MVHCHYLPNEFAKDFNFYLPISAPIALIFDSVTRFRKFLESFVF